MNFPETLFKNIFEQRDFDNSPDSVVWRGLSRWPKQYVIVIRNNEQ